MIKSQQKSKLNTKTSSSKPSSQKISPSKRKARHQIVIAFLLSVSVFTGVLAVEFLLKFLESKPEAISKSQSKSTPKSKDKEIETSRESKDKEECNSIPFVCFIKDSVLLGQVQNFAVLVAAFLYLFDVSERRKQMERQAWQLIDCARDSETSGGRYQAIIDLYEEDKETLLKGLDANGADLIGINLEGANLERANLERALLTCANLQKINLHQAKLQKANLRGAKLQGANLWGANLEEADLQEYEPDINLNLSQDSKKECIITNLEGAKLGKANLRNATLNNANLRNTNLTGADLRGTDLRCADISGADFSKANIQGAIFSGVKNLKIEQFNQVDNYQEAKYDDEFCSKHPDKKLMKYIPPKLEDIKSKEQIIPRLLQKIQDLIKGTENGDLLQDNSQIKEFIDDLNVLAKLISEDKSLSSDCQAIIAEIQRGLKDKLNQVLTDRQKIYEQTEKFRENVNNFNTELEKRPVHLYSQWLENEENITLLRDKGIRYFLNANKLIDNVDLEAKLKQDIYKYLKLMYTVDNLEHEEINLSLPFDIYLKIFKVISEQVIPELEKSKPNGFTNEMSPDLKSDCRRVIKELQRRLDSVTKN